MNTDEFYYLGKILKVHGNKGHLWIHLETDDPEKYSGTDVVYVAIAHDRIPFMVDDFELRSGNKAIIHIEDVHSADDALPFTGKELYLPLDRLPKLKGKKFYYHEVTGFTVVDENRGELGILASILEMPGQSLMQVLHGKKEILVPLTDDIIIKVDRKNKRLHIRAPEGLIDVYL